MNALTLLKADHKKVAAIFEKLEPTTERGVKTREELFASLKEELDIHSRIEETFLYPVLEKAEETHDIALEAIEEHAVVKDLLAELEKLAKDDESWGRKAESPSGKRRASRRRRRGRDVQKGAARSQR